MEDKFTSVMKLSRSLSELLNETKSPPMSIKKRNLLGSVNKLSESTDTSFSNIKSNILQRSASSDFALQLQFATELPQNHTSQETQFVKIPKSHKDPSNSLINDSIFSKYSPQNSGTKFEKEVNSLQAKLLVLSSAMPVREEDESDEENREILKRLIKLRYTIESVARNTTKNHNELSAILIPFKNQDQTNEKLSELLYNPRINKNTENFPEIVDLSMSSINDGIRRMIYEAFQKAREIKTSLHESDKIFIEFQLFLKKKAKELEKRLGDSLEEQERLKTKICQCIQNSNDQTESCNCIKKQLSLEIEIKQLKQEKNDFEKEIRSLKNLMVEGEKPETQDQIPADLNSQQNENDHQIKQLLKSNKDLVFENQSLKIEISELNNQKNLNYGSSNILESIQNPRDETGKLDTVKINQILIDSETLISKQRMEILRLHDLESDWERKCDELQINVRDLQDKLESSERRLNDQKSYNDLKLGDLAKLASKIQKYELEIQNKDHDYQNLKTDKNNERQEFEAKIQEYQNQILKLSKDAISEKEQMESLKNQLKLESEKSSSEKQELDSKIAYQEQQIEILEEKSENYAKRIEHLKESVTNTVSAADSVKHMLQDKVASLQDEVQELKEKCLANHHENVQLKIQMLSASDNFNREKLSYEENISNMQATINEQEIKLSASEKEILRIKHELSTLLESTASEKHNFEEIIHSYQDQINILDERNVVQSQNIKEIELSVLAKTDLAVQEKISFENAIQNYQIQIQDYEKSSAKYLFEIEELKKSIEVDNQLSIAVKINFENLLQAYQKQVQSLEEKANEYLSAIENHEKSIQNLLDNEKCNLEELQKNQEIINSQEAEIGLLKLKVSELSKDDKENKEAIICYETAISEYESQTESMRTKIRNLSSENEYLQDQMKAQLTDITCLQNSLQEVQDDRELQRSKLMQDLKTFEKLSNEESSKRELEIQNMNKIITKLHSNLDKSNHENNILNEKLVSLRKISDATIVRQTTIITELKEKNEQLQFHYDQLQSSISLKMLDYNELVSDLEKQKNMYSNEMENTKLIIDNSALRILLLEKELEHKRDNNHSLKETISNLKNEMDSLNADFSRKSSLLEQEQLEKENEFKKLQSDYDELVKLKQWDAIEIVQLQQQLEAAKKEFTDEITKHISQISEKNLEIEKLNSSSKEKDLLIDANIKEIEIFKATQMQDRNHIDSTQIILQDKENHIINISKERSEEIQKLNQVSSEEKSKLLEEISNLSAKNISLLSQIEDSSAQLIRLQNDLEKQLEIINSEELKVKTLNEQLALSNEKIYDLQLEINNLIINNAQHLESSKLAIENYQTEISSIEESKRQTDLQLESFQNQINCLTDSLKNAQDCNEKLGIELFDKNQAVLLLKDLNLKEQEKVSIAQKQNENLLVENSTFKEHIIECNNIIEETRTKIAFFELELKNKEISLNEVLEKLCASEVEREINMSKLQTQTEKGSVYETKLSEMQTILNQKQDLINILDIDKKYELTKSDNLESALKALEYEIQIKENEIKEYMTKFNDLETERLSNQSILESEIAKNLEYEAQIKELKDLISSQRECEANQVARIGNLQNQIQQMSQKLKNFEYLLECKDQVLTEATDNLRNIEKEKEEDFKKLTEYEMKIDEYQISFGATNKLFADKDSELKAAQHELQQITRQAQDSLVCILSKDFEIEERNRKLTLATEKLKQIEKENESNYHLFQTEKAKHMECENQIIDLHSLVAEKDYLLDAKEREFQKNLAALESNCKLESSRNELISMNVSILESELHKKEQTLKETFIQLQSIENELQCDEKIIISKNNQISEYEKVVYDLQHSIRLREEQFNNFENNLRESLKSAELSIASETSRNKDMSHHLSQIQEELIQKDKDLAEANVSLQALEFVIEEEKNNISEANSKLAVCYVQIAELKSEIEINNQILKTAETNFKVSLQQAEQIMAGEIERNYDISKEIEFMRSRIEQKDQALISSQNILNEKISKLKMESEKLELERTKASQYEQERIHLRKSIEAKELEFITKENEYKIALSKAESVIESDKTISDKLIELEAALMYKESELNAVISNLSDIQSKHEEDKMQFNTKLSKIEDFEKQINNLKISIKEKEDVLSARELEFKTSLANAESILELEIIRNDQITIHASNLTSSLNKKESELEEYRFKLSELEKDLSVEKGNLETEIIKVKSLEEQIKVLQDNITVLHQEYSQKEIEYKDAEIANEQLLDSEKSTNSNLKNTINLLEKEIIQKNTELQNALDLIQDLENKSIKSKDTLSEMELIVLQLEAKVSSLEEYVGKKENLLQSKELEYRVALASAESIIKSEISENLFISEKLAKLESELNNTKSDLNNAHQLRCNIEEELKTKQKDLEIEKSKVVDCEKQIEELHEAVNSKEDALLQKVVELQQSLIKSEQLHNAEKSENSGLFSKELNEKQESLNAALENLNKCKFELETKQEQLNTEKDIIIKLNARIIELQDIIENNSKEFQLRESLYNEHLLSVQQAADIDAARIEDYSNNVSQLRLEIDSKDIELQQMVLELQNLKDSNEKERDFQNQSADQKVMILQNDILEKENALAQKEREYLKLLVEAETANETSTKNLLEKLEIVTFTLKQKEELLKEAKHKFESSENLHKLKQNQLFSEAERIIELENQIRLLNISLNEKEHQYNHRELEYKNALIFAENDVTSEISKFSMLSNNVEILQREIMEKDFTIKEAINRYETLNAIYQEGKNQHEAKNEKLIDYGKKLDVLTKALKDSENQYISSMAEFEIRMEADKANYDSQKQKLIELELDLSEKDALLDETRLQLKKVCDDLKLQKELYSTEKIKIGEYELQIIDLHSMLKEKEVEFSLIETDYKNTLEKYSTEVKLGNSKNEILILDLNLLESQIADKNKALQETKESILILEGKILADNQTIISEKSKVLLCETQINELQKHIAQIENTMSNDLKDDIKLRLEQAEALIAKQETIIADMNKNSASIQQNEDNFNQEIEIELENYRIENDELIAELALTNLELEKLQKKSSNESESKLLKMIDSLKRSEIELKNCIENYKQEKKLWKTSISALNENLKSSNALIDSKTSELQNIIVSEHTESDSFKKQIQSIEDLLNIRNGELNTQLSVRDAKILDLSEQISALKITIIEDNNQKIVKNEIGVNTDMVDEKESFAIFLEEIIDKMQNSNINIESVLSQCKWLQEAKSLGASKISETEDKLRDCWNQSIDIQNDLECTELNLRMNAANSNVLISKKERLIAKNDEKNIEVSNLIVEIVQTAQEYLGKINADTIKSSISQSAIFQFENNTQAISPNISDTNNTNQINLISDENQKLYNQLSSSLEQKTEDIQNLKMELNNLVISSQGEIEEQKLVLRNTQNELTAVKLELDRTRAEIIIKNDALSSINLKLENASKEYNISLTAQENIIQILSEKEDLKIELLNLQNQMELLAQDQIQKFNLSEDYFKDSSACDKIRLLFEKLNNYFGPSIAKMNEPETNTAISNNIHDPSDLILKVEETENELRMAKFTISELHDVCSEKDYIINTLQTHKRNLEFDCNTLIQQLEDLELKFIQLQKLNHEKNQQRPAQNETPENDAEKVQAVPIQSIQELQNQTDIPAQINFDPDTQAPDTAKFNESQYVENINNLQATISKLKENEECLNDLNNSNQEMLFLLNEQKNILDRNVENLTVELENNQKKYDELNQKYEKTIKEKKLGSFSSEEKIILEITVQNLTSDLENAKKKYEDLKIQTDSNKEKPLEIIEQKASLEQTVQTLKNELETNHKLYAEIKLQNDLNNSAKETVLLLTNQKESLTNEVENIQKQYAELKLNFESINRQLFAHNQENHILNERLANWIPLKDVLQKADNILIGLNAKIVNSGMNSESSQPEISSIEMKKILGEMESAVKMMSQLQKENNDFFSSKLNVKTTLDPKSISPTISPADEVLTAVNGAPSVSPSSVTNGNQILSSRTTLNIQKKTIYNTIFNPDTKTLVSVLYGFMLISLIVIYIPQSVFLLIDYRPEGWGIFTQMFSIATAFCIIFRPKSEYYINFESSDKFKPE